MTGGRRPAVFLDRDGVLNRAVVRNGRPHPPTTAAELELLPGMAAALARLRAAGYLLICVTNQPDVARGQARREDIEAIHARLRSELPLDEIVVSYEDGDHPRRKPNPGMLLEAAERQGIDLAASFMIGDRWKDIEAGRRAGCSTVFVDYGYAEARPQPPADATVARAADAVDWILARRAHRGGPMKKVEELKIKLFADGADKAGMLEMYAKPYIKGFTTNPTLMCKAGVRDYERFAREILAAIPDRPISFEVFSDEFPEMERQARLIAAWGENVYVKIPVTNTRGEFSGKLIRRLAGDGVKLNVTAILALAQVRDVAACLKGGAPSVVSVFAGRVADTGVDPMPLMAAALVLVEEEPAIELLWASPRELLNVFQAEAVGCHIITATNDVLKKLALVGKDLAEFSLDTVKMFRQDAVNACFSL